MDSDCGGDAGDDVGRIERRRRVEGWCEYGAVAEDRHDDRSVWTDSSEVEAQRQVQPEAATPCRTTIGMCGSAADEDAGADEEVEEEEEEADATAPVRSGAAAAAAAMSFPG